MKISQPKKSHKKLIIAIVSVLLLAGIGTATFFILNKDNSSSNKETNTEVATNTDVASNTDVALNDTTETTETVEETTETVTTETVEEEPSEEPSVETPSENTTTTTTTTPSETPSVPTHTHNYKSTVTNATCTSQGYTTYTCECGDSYVSNYTSGSHNYSNGACTTCGTADPNVQKHWCGTPMKMMSGYIHHPAEGYTTLMVTFSNGDRVPYVDKGDGGAWISDYMRENNIISYSIAEHFVETTPAWREENVTQMCCPSCRYADNGFVAY